MHSLLISSSELEAMEKSSIAMAASLEYSVSAAMARSYGVGGAAKAHTRHWKKEQVCGCDGRRAAVRPGEIH
jgi:predicted oxidoreductase